MMQILIKCWYLAKFLSVRRVLNILLVKNVVKQLKSLCVILPKMGANRKDFDETRYIFPNKE